MLKKNLKNKKFNEWLAGLIDGDGYFYCSKTNQVRFEITQSIRDLNCLFLIKNKFGGAIRLKQGHNWLKYTLCHKKGLIKLINSINGLIRNPKRLDQLNKLCIKFNLNLQYPSTLNYSDAWLSGFLDSDGSVYMNTLSTQIFITASQKTKLIMEPLIDLYGGKIYFLKNIHAFKWYVYKKEEILKLKDYFKENPLRSKKMNRIRLIDKIYKCFHNSSYKASEKSIKGKIWLSLKKKWDEVYSL